ncbi:hypothetical protein KC19_11G097200 [Ceratodon purpureus]|uniref:Uncharacterized protein n=1 Tax=Ceratodon purpureus TaxID=3225 RepID=A0A8T0GCT5_CERPU|nr:hypothetical protein KC19_11G097200 [Ceratodon purpureus]
MPCHICIPATTILECLPMAQLLWWPNSPCSQSVRTYIEFLTQVQSPTHQSHNAEPASSASIYHRYQYWRRLLRLTPKKDDH